MGTCGLRDTQEPLHEDQRTRYRATLITEACRKLHFLVTFPPCPTLQEFNYKKPEYSVFFLEISAFFLITEITP